MDTDPASMGIEIMLILALILANGMFAMSEIAIVSSRKARLERLAEEGTAGARTALRLANDPTQLLSTVQVGITLIGILTGAYGGATLAKPVGRFLAGLPIIGPYGESLGFTVVIVVVTYLSLIVGELVPKKVALNNPESIAAMVAVPMQVFAKVASPVVRLLSSSTELVLKVTGVKKSDEPPVTEEEIKLLIAEGTEYGTFEHAEKTMVERVFRFGDMRIGALMTPRTQADWIDLEDSDEQKLALLLDSSHSMLPVARGNLDELVGAIKVRDVLADRLAGKQLSIEKHIQEPLIVPRSMRAFRLLELFQQEGRHFAIVMDEYGGMTGLITIHDLLEEIVGEMPQDDEEEAPFIVQRDDGSWLVDGLIPVDEFKEYFGFDELPGEDRELYQTLGGFITSFLGNIPQTADFIEWGGLRFEIVDMDRARVDKVLLTKLPNDEGEEE